jgi:hypothetical protein
MRSLAKKDLQKPTWKSSNSQSKACGAYNQQLYEAGGFRVLGEYKRQFSPMGGSKMRIPPSLRNEMSTQYPKSPLKTPKYSTLTPKKVIDSSVSLKKYMLVLYLNTAISWALM